MDIQDSSIKTGGSVLHSCFFILWAIVSSTLYGTVCMALTLFSKDTARRLAQLWNIHLLGIGGIKVKITGKDKLSPDKRYVFISNHQSALDIPVLYSSLHHALSFIAKKELFMIPVFGWGMAAVGHIWIDRKNARKAHASIKRAVTKLKRENISLILFPEGTRSKDGNVGDFKSGSFSLAIEAGVEVVPVAISNASQRLPRKSIRVIPGEVSLDIGDPIAVSELKEKSKAELCAHIHQLIKTMAEKTTAS